MNMPCIPFKLLLALLVGFVSLVQGQALTLADIIIKTPSCALPCFITSITEASCSLTDIQTLSSCVCTNHTLLTNVSGCVRLACDTPDQVEGSLLLDQLCPAETFPRESRQTLLKAVTIVTLVLAAPSIILRWVARCKSSTLGWDDYMALIATILLLGLTAIQLQATLMGFGLHVWNVDPEKAIPLLQAYWVSQQIYALCQLFFQVSIVALYARVFPARWFQNTVIASIAIFVVQDVIFLLMITVRCLPIQAIWDVRVEGRCLDLNKLGLAGSIMHIVEHFAILAAPVPELWRLKLSRRKRIQLIMVFSIGSFSCITSIVRMRYTNTYAPTADLTWDTVLVVVWSIIEVLSSVICINLPPCRQMISKLFPRKLFTTTGGDTSNFQQSGMRSTALEFGSSHRPGPYAEFDSRSLGTFTEISVGDTDKSSPWLSTIREPVMSRSRWQKSLINNEDGVSVKTSTAEGTSVLNVDINQSELSLQELQELREAKSGEV